MMTRTHPISRNNNLYRGRAPGTRPFKSEPIKSPIREFSGQVQWAWVATLALATLFTLYLGYLAVAYTA